MQLANALAHGEITIVNPNLGRVVAAIIIIMALWGQKIHKGDK
jgi:hypothetical protein